MLIQQNDGFNPCLTDGNTWTRYTVSYQCFGMNIQANQSYSYEKEKKKKKEKLYSSQVKS